MLAKVKTAAVVGLEGHLVDVEVDISSGLPSLTIVVPTHRYLEWVSSHQWW